MSVTGLLHGLVTVGVSAGTHPADQIDPRAVETAERRGLDLPRMRPQSLEDVVFDSDLVVTVSDLYHESLKVDRELHWSIPDPVSEGTPEAFDAVYDEIESRVSALASRLTSRSSPATTTPPRSSGC